MSKQAPEPADKGVWTPSNVITIVRILLVPVFVAALLAPWPEWFGVNNSVVNDWKSIIAAGIFVLISATDWLDGYLARSRDEVTDFGKFMDPLADKILVTAALIALVELGSLPTWVVLVILAREFIVSGVRMMAASKGVVIAASILGKMKTVFQMIAIVLFTVKQSYMVGTFGEAVSDGLWDLSWLVMLVALALTIASMVDYLYKARDLLGFGSAQSGAAGPSGELEAKTPALEDVDGLEQLARRVVETAASRKKTLATAESLTGGMIGAQIVSVPGSSEVFLGGVVSYANEVKCGVLGVNPDDLARDGAVSQVVACQMAEGALRTLGSDVAVSVTGIAGPGGAVPGKPVGTVWMGVSTANGTRAELLQLQGDRESIRRATTEAALNALLNEL